MKTKVTIVAGARPNFIKIAPIMKEFAKNPDLFSVRLVHTGQHYDKNMSDSFFEELGISDPDVNFQIGSGSHSEQTGAIMTRFEQELLSYPPHLVVVVGDVNSTLACAIAAKKNGVKVAHVEAGIRSGDISMPEEINRMVTDSITDFFFTTTQSASSQLLKEGHEAESIFFVGNVMIDTLKANLNRINPPSIFSEIKDRPFMVLTLHRPSNVDDIEDLKRILVSIEESSKGFLKIFPVHPRTKTKLEGIEVDLKDFLLVDPLSYLNFIYLIKNSVGIITDSGGITEEATVLSVPCLTLRTSTERPETITVGTNVLVGNDMVLLKDKVLDMVSGNWKASGVPELWDGKTSSRIIDVLKKIKF